MNIIRSHMRLVPRPEPKQLGPAPPEVLAIAMKRLDEAALDVTADDHGDDDVYQELGGEG